ncbi:MAG: hypothetical protein NXI32_11275 [bacterium]|nr:hypothetical protein [bacterium]
MSSKAQQARTQPKRTRRGYRPRLSPQANLRVITWRTDGTTHARVCRLAERLQVSVNGLLTDLIQTGCEIMGSDCGAETRDCPPRYDPTQMQFPQMDLTCTNDGESC